MRSVCTYPPAKFLKIMAFSKRKQRPRDPQKPITGATSPTGLPSGLQPFNYPYPTPPTLGTGNKGSLATSGLGGFTGGSSGQTGNTPIDQLLGRIYKKSDNGLRFKDVLGLLQGGQTDASQLLAGLVNSGDGFTDERWDMLYQYLLQIMSTSDQRNYDYTMLQESRQYNNPQNELARLMGAGVSRDAAIQILSGAAGGSGVGSVIGSGSNVSVPSPTGTSGALDLQRQQTTADIVVGATNALNSMLQTGMSMAQGVEQVKSMQYANQWSQMQLESYNSVQQITQALQTMQSSGLIESSEIDGLSNANDLIKFLQVKSKDNEQLAQLVQSPAYNRALGTSFGREYFNKYWQSMRDTRDAGTIFDEFLRSQRLNNALTSVNIDKVGSEMELIGTQNKLAEQQIIESCNRVAVGEANIQLMDKQGKWIDIQGVQLVRKTDAEVDLMGTQSYLMNSEAEQVRLNYEYNSAGFPMMKQTRILQCQDELLKWRCYTDKESREQRMRQWLQEPQNAADAAYLQMIHNNAVGDFATYYPNLWILSQGFQASGANDLLRTGAQGAGVLKLVPKP